jgi:hypothetical protein
VRDRVSIFLARNLDQALRNQRARDRGSQQVLAFIDGVGTEHREDEVANEFLSQVVDVNAFHPCRFGLGACRLELFTLADVGGKGDHFALVDILKPFQDHGGVQAAGIGENDFLDLTHRRRARRTGWAG